LIAAVIISAIETWPRNLFVYPVQNLLDSLKCSLSLYRSLEFFGDLERFSPFVSFVVIRRRLPFSSRKQAVQYCDSGCLQTLATQTSIGPARSLGAGWENITAARWRWISSFTTQIPQRSVTQLALRLRNHLKIRGFCQSHDPGAISPSSRH
jgi:hypothetical protein